MAGNLDVIAKFITVDNINDVVERGYDRSLLCGVSWEG